MLYDLNQLPQIWYKTLAHFFHKFRFQTFDVNLSIFARNNMIIAIYVENLPLYGTTQKKISKTKDVLKAKFLISDLRPISFYSRIILT